MAGVSAASDAWGELPQDHAHLRQGHPRYSGSISSIVRSTGGVKTGSSLRSRNAGTLPGASPVDESVLIGGAGFLCG
jgi:hypothetical protein